jgi:hypothetical protein
MILIIFTPEGLQQMQQEALNEQATLWVNPSLMEDDSCQQLAETLTVHRLPEEVNANKEKAVIGALTHVEKNSQDPDILIEYP